MQQKRGDVPVVVLVIGVLFLFMLVFFLTLSKIDDYAQEFSLVHEISEVSSLRDSIVFFSTINEDPSLSLCPFKYASLSLDSIQWNARLCQETNSLTRAWKDSDGAYTLEHAIPTQEGSWWLGTNQYTFKNPSLTVTYQFRI